MWSCEDPVTGNANGPLGAYLVQHQLVEFQEPYFTFQQFKVKQLAGLEKSMCRSNAILENRLVLKLPAKL